MKYAIRKVIRSDTPKEYKEHLLENFRHEVGFKLFNMLWENKLPCVVDISEEIRSFDVDEEVAIFHNLTDEVVYTIDIFQVNHKHVTLEHYGHYGHEFVRNLNFIDKLKWLFS